MKKDEKPDILAVINNYNFYDRQTNRETNRRIWRLYDQPGPEGPIGENHSHHTRQPTKRLSILKNKKPTRRSGYAIQLWKTKEEIINCPFRFFVLICLKEKCINSCKNQQIGIYG